MTHRTWRDRTVLALFGLSLGVISLPALGQSPTATPSPPPRLIPVSEGPDVKANEPIPALEPLPLDDPEDTEEAADKALIEPESPPLAPPTAKARFEGTPQAGLLVTLRADGSKGEDLHYQWLQLQGPQVRLDAPTGPVARFTTPEGSGTMVFLLTVANGAGLASQALAVPFEGRSSSEGSGLTADAGDDQSGQVGKQITLNAVRSQPRGQIGYRWIQVSGPAVTLKIEDGYTYTFVPAEPGLYRFALVVAAGSEISRPDYVDVWVQAGGSATLPQRPVGSSSGGLFSSSLATASVGDFVQNALSAMPEGAAAAGTLADAFEITAQRMDLYGSYAETFQEMSRRLEPAVPTDPIRRNIWIEQLFKPMTSRMVETMKSTGIDLAQPAAQSAPLSPSQKDRLAGFFREMADGFRAVSSRP